MADAVGESEFHTKGYVTTPVLSPAEVTDLLEHVSKLRPDGDFEPAAGSPMHFSVSDTNMEYRRESQDLLRRVFGPHVRRLLVGFRFLHGIFVVKPPGSSGLALHPDWRVTADRTDITAMIWCPLTDVGSHTIGVVEGSHGIVPDIEVPNGRSYCAEFADALRGRTERVPISAGEAVIFESSLLHCSVPNDSQRARIALQVTCIPVDATPVFFFKTSETQFEIIQAESDFWVRENLHNVGSRLPHWKSVGFIDSPNRPITEREYMTLLEKGDRTTLWRSDSASPSPGTSTRGRARRSWFGR